MNNDIHKIYELFCQYPLICTDSRRCTKDSLFFALKGDNFNGNRFATASLEAGCAYAIVDEVAYATDERIILVDNVLKTLQDLAAYHRQQFKKLPVIGITGTNGKTTTKELIAKVLSKKYDTLYTQGNLNNHIGVPLTLLQLKAHHELAIIEMGANHPGEIAELVAIAQPSHGLITNVGKAHLEGFGSFQGVIDTKAALYRYLQENEGIIFYNAANPILSKLAEQRLADTNLAAPQSASIAYIPAHCSEQSQYVRIEWKQQDKTYQAQTQLVGNYNQENIQAAITLGNHFDVPAEDIKCALEEYCPSNNRSQWMESAHNQLIIDAYNANPTSMHAAVDNFLTLQHPSKMAILGAMHELGNYSQEEHLQLLKKLQSSQLQAMLLIGPEFQGEDCQKLMRNDARFRCFENTEDCQTYLQQTAIQQHLILIKGSRSNQLEKLLSLL